MSLIIFFLIPPKQVPMIFFETEQEIPKIVASQRNRINPPDETNTEYFRRAVFIPSSDDLIGNFKSRFQDNHAILEAFEVLMPNHAPRITKTIFKV